MYSGSRYLLEWELQQSSVWFDCFPVFRTRPSILVKCSPEYIVPICCKSSCSLIYKTVLQKLSKLKLSGYRLKDVKTELSNTSSFLWGKGTRVGTLKFCCLHHFIYPLPEFSRNKNAYSLTSTATQKMEAGARKRNRDTRAAGNEELGKGYLPQRHKKGHDYQ